MYNIYIYIGHIYGFTSLTYGLRSMSLSLSSADMWMDIYIYIHIHIYIYIYIYVYTYIPIYASTSLTYGLRSMSLSLSSADIWMDSCETASLNQGRKKSSAVSVRLRTGVGSSEPAIPAGGRQLCAFFLARMVTSCEWKRGVNEHLSQYRRGHTHKHTTRTNPHNTRHNKNNKTHDTTSTTPQHHNTRHDKNNTSCAWKRGVNEYRRGAASCAPSFLGRIVTSCEWKVV